MSCVPTIPPDEVHFLARMFDKDAKNYHVWSYRQWLVRYFSLWDSELPYVESLIDADVRNNSAWNHRWFVVFSRHTDPTVDSLKHGGGKSVEREIAIRELDYTKSAIRRAPQNLSPWNYLRGILKNQKTGLADLRSFAEEFADLENEDKVRSSHALDFLADLYAEREEKSQADKALELLATKYDPIRKNYWNYRRSLLGFGVVGA